MLGDGQGYTLEEGGVLVTLPDAPGETGSVDGGGAGASESSVPGALDEPGAEPPWSSTRPPQAKIVSSEPSDNVEGRSNAGRRMTPSLSDRRASAIPCASCRSEDRLVCHGVSGRVTSVRSEVPHTSPTRYARPASPITSDVRGRKTMNTPLLSSVRAAVALFPERDAVDPDRYPAENVADLRAVGLLGAAFPGELGGTGATLAELTAALELVAEASPSTALLVAMPVGLASVYATSGAAVPPERLEAWNAQRARVAADYAKGHLYAACNSEKGAGGSLAATKTAARREEDGGHRLTGEKILASFGAHADWFFSTAKLPEGGVEFFVLDAKAPGVTVRSDWNGFGMRSTESHSVHLDEVRARDVVGYPGFLEQAQPVSHWHPLFAAISLGCAAAMLRGVATPTPSSPVLRARCNDALMRYESLRAYLLDTAARVHPGLGPAVRARVMRTKTFVTQESTKLCAELFALSGGRHFTRGSRLARTLADSFAGTALRPPLPLALDALAEQMDLGELAGG